MPTAEAFLEDKPSADAFLSVKPSADDFLSQENPPPLAPGQSLLSYGNPPRVASLGQPGDGNIFYKPAERISEAVGEISSVAGKAAATVGNLPWDFYNAAARATGHAPVDLPFAGDKPLIANSPRLQSAIRAGFEEITGPVNAETNPRLNAAVEGLTQATSEAVSGFTKPESLIQMPLLETRVGRAAFAGVMALETPKQIAATHAVLNDPKATPADKWKALGQSGIHLAMTAAVTLGLSPEEVRAKMSPEEAAAKADSLTAYTDRALADTRNKLTLTDNRAATPPEAPAEVVEKPNETPGAQPNVEAVSPNVESPPTNVEATAATPQELIVDQPVKKTSGAPIERPPDIIDHITENYGAIKNKSSSTPGSEGYYSDAYKTARKSRPTLFSDTGSSPDEIVQNLRDDGVVGDDFTVDDLWDSIQKAHGQRGAFFRGETPEAKESKFHKALGDAAESSTHYTVSVGDLGVGDKFTIKGEPFEVQSIDPDTGEVTVKDGKKFGVQTIPDGADVPINKGSLQAKEQSADFAPPAPKLAPGANQGDLVDSSQKDTLSLQGESETDAARIQAENEQAERDAAEAEKNQTSFTGMGGAVPKEFENQAGTATGIKNATQEAERAKRGLPPAYQPLRKSFGETWDRTMARIDQNPGWQDQLIEELKNKPRPITDEEDAALLHRQVDLQNEYGKATRDLAQAYSDGRTDDVQREQLRVANFSDQLQDLYNISKTAGTETARGLAARRMMANEDFSLAQMELSKRAAVGGRPLTDAEHAQTADLHRRLEETKKAHEDYVAKNEERISKMEAARALDKIKLEEAAKPQAHPAVMEAARKIVAKLEVRATAAEARLRARLGRTSAGLDPTILKDLAEIGVYHLGKGAIDLADWSADMAKRLPDVWNDFKDHAQQIFDESQKLLTEATKGNLEAAREMRNKPPEEQIEANATKIADKVAAGKKGDITWYVQRIARLLIQSGVKDRDALIDRVHGILQRSMPDITRREAMDAISGYGDFKQLSKDAISVQLRGLKGEMQQLAKLEDMGAGKPPLKTGIERRQQTDAERQLIKKVNDAKREFQIPISDPSTQLKSALDTYKTALENRTKDLQDKLDRKDFAPRERRELKLDDTANRLKANNERVKQEFRNALIRDRLAKRTKIEKFLDTAPRVARSVLLSGPQVLAKLTAAALARGIVSPLESAVGSGLRQAIPRVAERSPRYGEGLNLKAEVKAVTQGVTQGMKDAWQVLRTGKSDLDVNFGKVSGIPQSWIDIFGNIHGALKAPIKRAQFAKSFENLSEYYAKKGADINNEFVQIKIGMEAYQDAERSIFLQENMLNDAFKRGLTAFDKRSKATGERSIGGMIGRSTAQTLLPITKVPTNIAAEAFEFATGSVSGSVKLAKAYRRGFENLQPEEADLIMRHLQKGSLGAAAILLGFFSPKVLGGFYQQGEKRDKKDVQSGGARIAGHDIPPQILDNPLAMAAELGATVRRVADSKLNKKDKENQGLGAGALAGAVGLADAVPFVRETTEIAKMSNPHERGQFFGELAKSRLVPQFLSWIAQHTDTDANGNLVKRDPKTIGEAIKTGIPGLRETVPKKKNQ